MYYISIEELREKITEYFYCEKLEETDNIEKILETFKCEINPGMEAHLTTYEALNEDKSNSSKHYIIKDKDENVAFYFSLRCSSLSKCINATLVELYNRMPEISEAIKNNEYGRVQIIAENLGISSNKIVKNINAYSDQAASYAQEMSVSTEKPVYRVLQSIPSIELVQFCANSNYRDKWKNLDFPISMGTAVFWFFITPIIKDIQNIVGCKCVHLFAADLSEDSSLCNYYINDLGFQYIDTLAFFKPFYDFNCIAMYLDAGNIDNLMIEKLTYILNDMDAALDKNTEDII